jgi:RNA polymerase sigma factor (sigma-70 family)
MSGCDCPPYDCAGVRLRFLAGDQAAFTELEHKFTRRVGLVVARVLGPELSAEWDDARQFAFMRIFRRIDQWEDRAPFCAWVIVVAVNTARTLRATAIRSRTRMSRLVPDDVPTAGWQTREYDVRECVTHILGQVEETQRRAFELWHQGRSPTEIAETMGMSLRAIQYRLAAVRERLRPCWEK